MAVGCQPLLVADFAPIISYEIYCQEASCFGGVLDHDQNKTVPVLHIPRVDSPQSAVKVAIASKAR
jgi:hypothetical protein